LDASSRDRGNLGILSENAALQYWLAFGLIPDLRRNASIWKASSDDAEFGFAVPVSAELAACLDEQCTQALVHLHRGTRLSCCDWGTDLRLDGLKLRAPFDQKCWDLARVALLRARWSFEHGDWDGGIDNVIATMRLARHLSRDKLWHSIHFGCMIEGMATGTSAVYLQNMPMPALDELQKSLASLPPFTSMREAILYSENAIDWALDEFKKANTEEQLRETLNSIAHSADFARDVFDRVHNRDGLVQMADECRGLIQMFADAMSLPPSTYERRYAAQFEPMLRKNPLADLLGVWYQMARHEEATAHCRLMLLRAAIDVVERGIEALSVHHDPYGDGPFVYAPFDGGFELLSGLLYGGRRVRMQIGLRRS
jgi:hypothetical protein